MSDQPAPIIIKRKKVIAGGHHGGAWKVAYADFVTAMMAFFLLMWLLGATTEKQRKGIADYFNPSVPINKVSGGGVGAFGGESIFSENSLSENGTGAGLTIESTAASARGKNGVDPEDEEDTANTGSKSDSALEKIAEKLTALTGDSLISDLMRRHVVLQMTDEGLIVEIFDIPDHPLFEQNAEATADLRDVIAAVSEVFRLARNEIAIQGHTATVPLAARENLVWEQSAARSDTVRKLLFRNGIQEKRVQRVTGFADRKPASPDTLSVRNNRIEIMLLRERR